MVKEDYYTPGVCNINPSEVKSRRSAGRFGLVASIITFIALIVFNVNYAYGGIMFLPIWIAAVGYLQSKNKFCTGYGSSGMYSASSKMGDTSTVEDKANIAADKVKVRKINIQAFAIGVLGAAICIVILTLV